MARTKKDQPWSRVYPDSVAGALHMMRDNSNIPDDVLDDAEVYPDLDYSGVWKLEWNPPVDGYVAAVAYLAGYIDPWGREREENDFEVEESFDDDATDDKWGDP